jgi:hypothetical protein
MTTKAMTMVTLLLAATSVSAAPKKLAIDDPRLRETTTPCRTDVSISAASDGYRLGGDVQWAAGKALLWCPGARHTWKGTSRDVQGGALKLIESDPDAPLVFEVTARGGYVYKEGAGKVVLADGTTVELPSGARKRAAADEPAASSGGTLVEVGKTADREAPSPLPGAGDETVRYKVTRLGAEQAANVYMRALLRDIGCALLDQPGGAAVKVTFADGHCGFGWVDEQGDLQSVVDTNRREPPPSTGPGFPQDPCLPLSYTPAPTDRLFERRDGAWSAVKPGLSQSKSAKGSTWALPGGRPLEPTKALLHHLGIAVGRAAGQRVRVELEDGRAVVGTSGARGAVTVDDQTTWSLADKPAPR